MEFIVLVLLTVFTGCHGNTESKLFRKDDSFDGFLVPSGYLTDQIVAGSVSCAVKCAMMSECKSYFFDASTSSCRCHGSVLADTALLTTSLTSSYFTLVTECPDGWLLFRQSCYLIDNVNTQDYTGAKAFCAGRGAHVLRIDDNDENDYLKQLLATLPTTALGYWIGLVDTDTPGTWFWEDNGDLASNTYTDWDSAAGQPAVNSEHCAGMFISRDYLWHDTGCRHAWHTICEMEK